MRSVRIGKAAQRQLDHLSEGWQHIIANAILELEEDEEPADAEQLQPPWPRSYWRLKLPPYRVLYRTGKGFAKVFRVEKRSADTYRRYNPWR